MTPSMSRPRAATSVATRTSICSSLNCLPRKEPLKRPAWPRPDPPQPPSLPPPRLPESLQALGLGKVAMQLPDTQAHQAQEDVQAVGLLLGLGEEHHVVGERPGQQGWRAEGDPSWLAPAWPEPATGRWSTSSHLPQWPPCPPRGWAGCGQTPGAEREPPPCCCSQRSGLGFSKKPKPSP